MLVEKLLTDLCFIPRVSTVLVLTGERRCGGSTDCWPVDSLQAAADNTTYSTAEVSPPPSSLLASLSQTNSQTDSARISVSSQSDFSPPVHCSPFLSLSFSRSSLATRLPTHLANCRGCWILSSVKISLGGGGSGVQIFVLVSKEPRRKFLLGPITNYKKFRWFMDKKNISSLNWCLRLR